MTAHSSKTVPAQSDYFEVSLDSVKSGTTVHFDVYADVEQGPSLPGRDLVLYAKAPFDWTEREIRALAHSGFTQLFIRNDDRNRFLRYVKMHDFVPEINYSLAAKIASVRSKLLAHCWLRPLF